MSGLEWLAVSPILESGVKAIFKAYMLNKAALETFDDAAQAVSDLEVCHMRLVFWLIASGIISHRAPAQQQGQQQTMQRLYATVLAKMQDDFAELQTIFAAYKFPADVVPCAPPPSAAWTVDSIKAIQERLMAKLKEDLSYRRRLKFQIQDKKRVDDALARLARSLDMLIGMLPPAGRLQLDVEERNYTMDAIADKPVGELLQLMEQATAQGDDTRATCCMTVATFKQAKEEYKGHLEAQRGLCPPTRYSTLIRDATLVLSDQPPSSSPGARQLGTLTMPGAATRPVLVEVLRKKEKARGGLVLIQQAEVNLLCALLSGSKPDIHPDLRALQCLGHLGHPTDANLLALVFALPPSAVADAAPSPPTTLYALLSEKRSSPSRLPTLEARRDLSIRLAKAVWRLHHYGWLHKGLVSSNILFSAPPTDAPALSTRDFFLAGFANTRLQTSLGLTNTASAADAPGTRADYYRHPAFLGGVTDFAVDDGYAPAFDLWSLGVVLCEIAMWAPADAARFVRSRGDANPFAPAQMADVLRASPADALYAKSPVAELAHRMGEQYRGAVVACFAAGDDAREPRWVAENVVRPLVLAAAGAGGSV